MSFTTKFAALGAAAAISATGLVAATGTSAHAADLTKSVTYKCTFTDPLSQSLFGEPEVTTAYTFPSTLSNGARITAKVTLPQEVTSVIAAAFKGNIGGSVTGKAAVGSQTGDVSLTIPDQSVGDGSQEATVNASGTIAGLSSVSGAQELSAPASVTATFSPDANNTVTANCTAASGSDLSVGSVTVTKSSTPPATSAALTAAKKQLAKDKAALAKAKKAFKKAKGHKKAVLKKKIVKLNKKIKADKKKIASLSK